MKKNIIFYGVACILLVVSFVFFNKAHEEVINLSELSNRSTIVYNNYQNLSKQINNAAFINPGLKGAGKYSNETSFFYTDSEMVVQPLMLLRAIIRDSINFTITEELFAEIMQELPWLLMSNVPDSILNHKAAIHIASLKGIDSLIKMGINRTNFLFEFRKKKLNTSIGNLKAWMFFSIILSSILLVYTTINLFWHKVKIRRKEEKLQRKDLRFRNTLDVMIEGIQIHDFDWKYVYVNDALVKYSTYTKDELLGFTLMEKYPGIETGNLFKTFQKCMNERVSEQMETEFVFPNGTKSYFELSIQPVPEGLFILSVDITSRKNAENERIASESKYRSVVETMHECLLIEDAEGRLVYANNEFSKTFGFEGNDLKTLTLSDYTDPAFYPEIVERHNNRIKGLPVEDEFIYKGKRKDGTEIWIEARVSTIVENGKISGTLSLERDITERIHFEQNIIKANRLYKFLSNINKSIVHIKNEQELFENACRIAMEIGQFKLAYAGMLDENNKLNIVSLRGYGSVAQSLPQSYTLNYNDPANAEIPTIKVMKTGKYVFNNDMQGDPAMSEQKDELILRGIKASISLPIFKFGKMVGIFGLHAGIKDFFDSEEIALLDEAANDISFALENFEKERNHKDTEDLIIKTEKRFRALIENSSDMKTLTSSEGKFIYGSPSISKVFDYTNEEFLNKSAFNFFHPDDIPDLLQNRTEILKAPGKSFGFTYRLLHKKGHWIWCEGTLTNMLHEPAINALVSNFRDITDKRKAEQRKEFDQNNLSALINSTNDLMWSINRNYKLITFNKPFYKIIKQVSGKELQKGDDIFSAVISQGQLESFRTMYVQAFTGEAFTEIQHVMEPFESWLEISFYPIKNGDEIIGTACHSRDITRRKKAEFEREKMIADIIQRNKNFEQFAYIVSHNLRAPVANILGLSNVLKIDLTETDKAKAQQFLFKAVENLDEIITDLNKILQTRTDVTENKEAVYFSALVRDIESSMQNLIQKQKVEIVTDFSEADKIITLKSYLHSIFYNLIANSIKYARPGITPTIEIKRTIDNRTVKIVFKDNGLGLDLDLHGENIFGLYKRFHLNFEGKGLGLFMTRTQLEVLGGSISVKSHPDKGSEFTIELPV